MKEKYNWHQRCIVSPAVVLRWPFTDTCCTNPAYLMLQERRSFLGSVSQGVRLETAPQAVQPVLPACAWLWHFKMGLYREVFQTLTLCWLFRGARGTVGRIPHLDREDADVFGALASLSPGACTQLLFQSSIWASRIHSQGSLNTPAPWWVRGNFA